MKEHIQRQGGSRGGGFGFQRKGGNGYCVCQNCGYSFSHQPGVPCRTMKCPHCDIPMLRTQTPGKDPFNEHTTVRTHIPDAPHQKISYPKVVAEKCIGCGVCIEVCSSDCIVLEDGKAFIRNELCRNCQLCIRACPENAIILE